MQKVFSHLSSIIPLKIKNLAGVYTLLAQMELQTKFDNVWGGIQAGSSRTNTQSSLTMPPSKTLNADLRQKLLTETEGCVFLACFDEGVSVDPPPNVKIKLKRLFGLFPRGGSEPF